jgi:hypothetical protein
VRPVVASVGPAIAGNPENDGHLSPWQEAVGHEIIPDTHKNGCANDRYAVAVADAFCAFLVYMLPPLPRCSSWAYSSLISPGRISLPRKGCRVRPAHRPFRGLLSVYSRWRPAHSRGHQFVTRYPKASDISSPPCLLRLLPAGAVAGWGLHPLESAALPRRTPTADVTTTQAARVPKVARGVGEVLVVLIETRIATKPPEGSLLIAHGDRRHRSAASGELVRAGMIAAAASRLDTELLKRGFLGWLRGERGHCSMARVPTIAEEDAKRPNRERESGRVHRSRRIQPCRLQCSPIDIRSRRFSLGHERPMFRGRRPAALDRPCRFGRGFRNGGHRRSPAVTPAVDERGKLPQSSPS